MYFGGNPNSISLMLNDDSIGGADFNGFEMIFILLS